MTKLQKHNLEELNKSLLSIHVPVDYLEYFELFEVLNKPDCYELVLHERIECIPKELQGHANVVLDGYCNPISILSHSFSLKKIFLVCKRRRWKISGETSHYSNSYELHEKGLKMTPALVSFFKMYDRIKSDKL